MQAPDAVVAIALLGTTAYIARSFIGLLGRRIDSKHTPAFNPQTDDRIARIEQAVDAIAVEVERISEGQRFTTRLLAEREPVQSLTSPKLPVQS
ncbi:MAG TPA: hypothetical protein VIJ16_08935 [Gemmatimonadaceae bacterium]